MNKTEENLLQDCLEAIEGGQPTPVSADEDTTNLAKLAATIRSMPHPNPQPAAERKWRQRPKVAGWGIPFNWKEWRPLLVPSAAAAFVTLVAFAALFSLGFWLNQWGGGRFVRLSQVSGVVEIAHASQPNLWQEATVGERLRSGDRIRTTGAGSSATLSYFEGSSVRLEADTLVVFERVDRSRDGSLRVVLSQEFGQSSHNIERLKDQKGFYIVYTPASAASVYGTEFQVAVRPNGETRYTVNQGQVLVSNKSEEVFLNAGQAIAIYPDQALGAPGYQFSLCGVLSLRQGSTWVVAHIPITVPAEALSGLDPQIGQIIQVDGRLLPSGEWIADWIAPSTSQQEQILFNGVLENLGSERLQVNGWDLMNSAGEGKDLNPGDTVQVALNILPNGLWQAANVRQIADVKETATPSPLIPPDPNAQPSLSFEPDELETAGCDATYNLTGVLLNEGEEADDYAANVLLGYQIIKGGAYVDGVTLDPQSWEQIAPGEQVEFDIHLDLNEASWNTAPDEAEVKVRVFIAQETNRPEGHRTRLTVTVIHLCGNEPTEPPGPTLTPTPALTPAVTPTPGPVPTANPDCTGAQPHPTGMTLAERYGVPYEEIMGWFCQGFGFGEIDLAYSLSQVSGQPVAEIFAMKLSGMGWGEIKQRLDPEGQHKDNNRKNNEHKNNNKNKNK